MSEDKMVSIPEDKFQELIDNQASLLNEINILKAKTSPTSLLSKKRIKDHYANVRIIEGMPVVGILEQENSGDKVFEGPDLGSKWGNLYIELLCKWDKKEKTHKLSYKKFLNNNNQVLVKVLERKREEIESLPKIGKQTVQQVTVDNNYNVKIGDEVPLYVVGVKDTYKIEFMEGKLKGQQMEIDAEYLNM